MSTWNEEKVVKLIKKILAPILAKGAHNLLDDAATLPLCKTKYSRVISCDAFSEDTDFIINNLSPVKTAGHRAIIQNLSDMAAMGAKPIGFLWSLEIPGNWLINDARLLKQFINGALKVCVKNNLKFYGGDLSFSASKFACTITIFGDLKGKSLTRSGAKANDILFLSKPVGSSAAGLQDLIKQLDSKRIKAHLHPKAEINLGQNLVGIASSCMDISDGLSRDLYRLCKASKVSAIVDNVAGLIDPHIRDLSNAAQIAFSSGEEYALLFTVPPKKLKLLSKLPNYNKLVPIGKIVASAKKKQPQVYIRKNSRLVVLEQTGYDHFSSFSLGQADL